MSCFQTKAGLGIVLAGAFLACAAHGQEVASQPFVPVSGAIQPTNDAANPSLEAADRTVDPATLLPELPALSARNMSRTSLVGGTIEKLDRVRDQFTLRIFGAGKMKISFDPRTRIYKNGQEAAASDLRPGDRVSIDTVVDGNTVFARNVRLNAAGDGESQGTVVGFSGGELTLRDALSPRLLKLRVTPQTRFAGQASASDLLSGSLIAIKFGSPKNGHPAATEISILAKPGAKFTFAGRVTTLDLRTGLLVLTSATDGKTYEIYLDPLTVADNDRLREAADVTVLTRFDGNRYVAQNVTVN
jgi:Domain of unknown function (DUF5666)